MDLFFFGTLRHGPLLEQVMGRDPALEHAHLPGFEARYAQGQDFPVLTQGQGADGVLVRGVSAEERARLDYYEGGFGYDLSEVTVETDAGPVAAMVYLTDETQPSDLAWSLSDWQRDWAEITMEAAAEIMRGYARGVPLAEIDARFGIIRARAAAVVANRHHQRARALGCDFTAQDVTLDQHGFIYEGFFRVEEMTLRHRRYDGTMSAPMHRTVYHVSDAVTLLPYDPRRDRVLLVEQLRIGPLIKGDPHPWMLEPIAGMIDAGETVIEAALREAEEEAGLTVTADAMHHVARYYPTPGSVAQVLHSYVAVCDLPDGAAGLGGAEEEHEDIRAHLVSFDDLMGMLDSGEAANAPLVLSAQWLAANRAALQGAAP